MAFRLPPALTLALAITSTLACDLAVAGSVDPEPEWIWGEENPTDGRRFYFRKRFELAGAVEGATLEISCDNHYVAYLNGIEVAAGDNWEWPDEVAVGARLGVGPNVLAVVAWNDGGPAGLVARLRVTPPVGVERVVVSDDSWSVSPETPPLAAWADSGFGDEAWPRAVSFGRVSAPAGPWHDVLASNEATPASDITVPPGFQVERLLSARRSQGSWVCLTFDDRGRLLVSPQYGGLLRIDLGASKPGVERLDLPFVGAQGLLWHDGSLFASVNASPDEGGGLYRCRDGDGDDRFDEVQRLLSFGSGGEHGPHAVAAGPDGWLYLVNGNMTELPDGIAPDSPHRNYAEDLLATREWDPRGHAVDVHAPGAHVLRYDPTGGQIELFAAGMRNPYDIAFSPDGELFTFDADMEWDIGTPWYRPTRVLHLVSAGEYGWRSGSGKWPSHYPDSLPATVDIGPGSPTGITFAARSRFPEPYRSSLLIGDWTFGRILAVHLAPDGASYRGEFEPFAEGKPLNVTDMEFGLDGALYFITGGRRTQAGLYRVRHDDAAEAVASSAGEVGGALRQRRDLEEYHRGSHPDPAAAVAAIWPHLGAEDRWVRYAARVALERQPIDRWRARALAERGQPAGDEARLALVRVDRSDDVVDRIVDAIEHTSFPQLDRESRLRELRILALAWVRGSAAEPDTVAAIRGRLDPHYPSGDPEIDAELYPLLAVAGADELIPRSLDALEATEDPAQRMRYAFLLRDVAEPWSDASCRRFRAWLDEARLREGGASLVGYVGVIERSWLKRLPASQRERFSAPVAASSDGPAAAPVAATARPTPSWEIQELVSSLELVETGRSFEAGRAAFEAAQCATCHRMRSKGGTSGPDLTTVASRFGRRDLLDSILRPSEAVSDQYQTTDFEMKNGEVVVGRVVEEDPMSYHLITQPLNPQRVTIGKNSVVRRTPSATSSMPEDLLASLSLEQVLDLLAYIESGGSARHRFFRRR